MTMSTVKKILTALAATVGALSVAQAAGQIDIIPKAIMHALTQGAILLGILGASPIGRLIFADAVTNDIVPPEQLAAKRDLAAAVKGSGPLALLLLLLPALALGSGCAHVTPIVAEVTSALPQATAYAEDASLILTGVETFEKGYYTVKPNPDQQKQVEIAIARARSAIDAGIRVCAAIKDLSQSQIGPAFADFQRVYQDVLALLGPLGAHRAAPGARFGAGPGGYAVPDPLLITLAAKH